MRWQPFPHTRSVGRVLHAIGMMLLTWRTRRIGTRVHWLHRDAIGGIGFPVRPMRILMRHSGRWWISRRHLVRFIRRHIGWRIRIVIGPHVIGTMLGIRRGQMGYMVAHHLLLAASLIARVHPIRPKWPMPVALRLLNRLPLQRPGIPACGLPGSVHRIVIIGKLRRLMALIRIRRIRQQMREIVGIVRIFLRFPERDTQTG